MSNSALRSFGLALVLCIGLSACGASSTTIRFSVKPLMDEARSAIQAYNLARPRDLQQQARDCTVAGARAQAVARGLQASSPPAGNRLEVREISRSLALATLGFADCARGAHSLDYPLLVQAGVEIQKANFELARAQRLDR